MGSSANWKYCVAGNIKKSHTDESGVLRYGTAAFTGGTKVYLCGKYWDRSHRTIRVIGLSRGRFYQVYDTDPALIENVRWQKVYKPSVLALMNDWEFCDCWWNNSPEDRRSVRRFVENWYAGHTLDSAAENGIPLLQGGDDLAL